MLGAAVEQACLGFEVLAHRGVELEMVLRQVGERGDREHRAVHPVEGQRVTRHLHGRVAHCALGHHREQGLHIGGLRRGQAPRQRGVADERAHGADQPARMTRGDQAGAHQERRGGFAAGAGDAGHRDATRRRAVDHRGDAADDRPGIGHDEDGQVRWHQRGPGRVGQDGDRTGVPSAAGELRPVRPGPGERGEQIAGDHAVSGDAHAAHVHVRFGCTGSDQLGQRCQPGAWDRLGTRGPMRRPRRSWGHHRSRRHRYTA